MHWMLKRVIWELLLVATWRTIARLIPLTSFQLKLFAKETGAKKYLES